MKGMKISVELVLNRSREEVWKMFDNVENLYKWQPTLKEFKLLNGEKGLPGAKSKLVYMENNRKIEMIETIASRMEPEEFSGTYETKGVTNMIKNIFIKLDDSNTKWIMESEFKFSGIFKIMSPFVKKSIIKRTETDMNRFKNLIEEN
jgi:hypothetical protein